MDVLSTYLPTDRLHALIAGKDLPEYAEGAALFCDISGFTALTELFLKESGPQRGAEEIHRVINQVFDSLIAEVNRYHGSVIIFGGDALTCWFDADHGLRAVACATAMQNRMQPFAAIQSRGKQTVAMGIKIAIAVGTVRRMVVGDPAIQLLDVLAGRTLDTLAAAEHQASRGEIVLDSIAQQALGDQIEIAAWRVDETSGARFAILRALRVPVQPDPWPALSSSPERVRPWVLPDIYERLHATGAVGTGPVRTGTQFLAEIRPAAPLFLYFRGPDYDADPEAYPKLNSFIQKTQHILTRYEGRLLQVIMGGRNWGDKGSYLYAVFGAPLAHEDDAQRAAAAALDLRAMAQKLGFIADARIGVSQGWLFAGPAGSETRQTYVTMGDEVNLAARLMQAADSFRILVSARIPEALGQQFYGDALPPLYVKGKGEAVQAFSLEGIRARDSIRLQEPRYALPMVGREAELQTITARLDLVLQGRGQIVGITGEPGVGKSRLMAEVIHRAQQRGMEMYGSECEAFGTQTSYLVWRRIWQGILGVDNDARLEDRLARISAELARVDAALLPRMPLLGPLLNLPIPDNSLTQAFDAKLRKTSLETLLDDYLRARYRDRPIVMV